MSREHRRKVLSSLIAAALVVFIFCQEHAGIGLVLFIPILIIWLPYSIFVSVAKPQRRGLQFTQMAIWIGAVAIIAAVQYVRHEVTRRNANEIAAAINRYSAQHGHCPATIEDIGITRDQLREKLGLSYYQCKGGKQTLFYAVTYTVFDTYDYDFSKGTWNYQRD